MSKLSKVQLHDLFELAQRLLGLEPQIVDESQLLNPFLGVFEITALCLFDMSSESSCLIGSAVGGLEGLTRAACLSGSDLDYSDGRITIRCLRLKGRVSGAIAFKDLEDPEQTAAPLTSLISMLHDRTHFRRKLSDDFKNGLTAILAAAGGLREAGPLSAVQIEMIRMVEEEATRLGNAVSWLDPGDRLDEGEADLPTSTH